MTKDPVCGKQVDQNNASATSTHGGQKYSFCSQECKNKFDQQPERYAHSQQQSHQPEHAGRS